MSYQNESFGMMDEGYFVPRGELLNWLNDLLKLNLTKIEQLGSGAVYCQVIDVIHPGKVALSKVNWKAKNDYEYINNLKILQNAFDKIGIKKHVEVEKLAKAKYQDNLEFVQWLKRYFDLNCGERANNYDAEERRGHVATDFSFAQKNVTPKTYTGSGIVKPVSEKPASFKKTPTSSSSIPSKEENQVPRMRSPGTGSTGVIEKRKEETPKVETIIQKEIVVEYKTDPVLEEQLKQTFADLEEMRLEAKKHEDKAKENNIKLDMIREIMKTEDDSDTKILMIEEILKE